MLLVDNGSAFTDHIEQCLGDFLDARLTPDNLEGNIEKYDSFVLSGRKTSSKKTNAVNSAVIKHAYSQGKPLFGICYGAEILSLTLGGTLRSMLKPRRGKETVTFEENPLCKAGVRQVFESHRYEIANLGSKLECLGGSAVCKNEFVRVDGKNMFGTQFHPEETDDGQEMLLKFAHT